MPPQRPGATNGMTFMTDLAQPSPRPSSLLHRQGGLAFGTASRAPGILAGLVEFQNAARGLDREAVEFGFGVAQLLGGDAVILRAKEQQGHGGWPRKVERPGQNQQH